ncbi:MAG: glycosyl transferase group 1 family protein [Candidatus Saccharibacteria bacterium]|nr:glycosyl transferase group 1 family protein [Candidatus Saccharibacteria bacterium]
MKPIRILQVVGTMDRGGVEAFMMNILRNIDKNQFTFIFLCYGNKKFDYENEIIALGSKIIRIPDYKKVGIVKHIGYIRKAILDENIDILHAHRHYDSVFSVAAARLARISVRIVHSHTTHSGPDRGLVKKIYLVMTRILINLNTTSYLACSIEAGQALFGDRKHMKIIRNGIELSDFVYNRSIRKSVRDDLHIKDDIFVIGHIGRFVDAKNHEFLIDIYHEVYKKNKKTALLLTGDGSLEGLVRKKVKDLNLEQNVIFLDATSNIPQLMQAMDVFVFPSKYEGLGIALIEAQAAGLKCLTSEGNVPLAAKVTENIKYLGLSEGAKYWAKEVLEINGKNYKRKDTFDMIQKAGYNMKDEVGNIESLYRSAIGVRS